MAKTKMFDLSGEQTRQRTLVRPLRPAPTKRHHERRLDTNTAMANHGAVHLEASTHAKQRTSLSASCTSFGGGRGETKNLRLKESTLGRENAGVCQSLNNSAPSFYSKRTMLARCIKPDSARSAELIASTLCCTSCSMMRACLHERSAAIVCPPCLSDGESTLNYLSCCAMISLLRSLRRMRSAL